MDQYIHSLISLHIIVLNRFYNLHCITFDYIVNVVSNSLFIGMFLIHRFDNCRTDMYVQTGGKFVFYKEAASIRLRYNAVPQWFDAGQP
jgi:hypothetical protein